MEQRGEGNTKSGKGRRKHIHTETTVSDGMVYEGQVVLGSVSVHHDSAICMGSVISMSSESDKSKYNSKIHLNCWIPYLTNQKRRNRRLRQNVKDRMKKRRKRKKEKS